MLETSYFHTAEFGCERVRPLGGATNNLAENGGAKNMARFTSITQYSVASS